jgi:aminobenzoyl-glutamate utilization protein B
MIKEQRMDIARWIDEHAGTFIEASDRVWASPEVKFKESVSAQVLADALEAAGFQVERGVAGMPTAFVGSYGAGAPVIAILGEYDALPGLSQDCVPYQKPLNAGAPGHGCGHNLLGAGSLAAAVGVAQALAAGEAHGTIRYYGCPAEEGGCGKGYMVKAGLFQDVDLAITWHPADINAVSNINFLAVIQAYFRFHGRTAHAAADPFNGRSALDAVELMNVGTNYLREHIPGDARIHYVITKGGGAANVVPDLAESYYMVRSPKMNQARELFERVKAVAQGAALMTGTTFEIIPDVGFSNLILNDTIAGVLHEKLLQIHPPSYTPEEYDFAREITRTVPAGSAQAWARVLGPEAVKLVTAYQDKMLFDTIMPLVSLDISMPGSTDVGDVSWVTPTCQISTTCGVLGTPGHSWQQVAQGGMSIGHKGLLYAGKVMGAAALEFMQRPELVQQAQAEFKERTKGLAYESPIPDGLNPPTY